MEELQELAETAWEEFRARYHRNLGPSTNGDGGSMVLGGDGILPVRSGAQRVAESILYVTELLNGSGELPDSNALVSYAGSVGQSAEDFTCTVLSLMFLMDGIYSIHSGRQDMVVQMFNNFIGAVVLPTTSENTPLKMRGLEATTQSPEEVPVSQGGETLKNESIRLSQQPKKRKLVKGSGMPSRSGKARATPKK